MPAWVLRWASGRSRRHLPPVVQRADERAFAWVARRHSPALDAIFPRLGRAADHGKIWLVAAGVLAAFGGKKGRAAAARGLAAVAVTSTVVNGPAKLAVRRHRPDSGVLHAFGTKLRAPFTSSFPSGHAASAAAFATAAGLEDHRAAAPLAALASGVAGSRVYTGVHFPSDVAAGAAIGATTALVLRARRHGSDAEAPGAALTRARSMPLGAGAGVVIAVNPSAGPALSRDPNDALREAFPDATIVEIDGDAQRNVREACDRTTRAIVVAGGDGSVNALAEVSLELGLPLGVVPAGTLNHLAGDLGLSTVDDAIEALRAGNLVAFSPGTIAGKPFLNTASFGAYAELVDQRERLEERIGKWPAAVVALGRVVTGHPPIRVEIDGRGLAVWAIFVGNGRYEPAGMLPVRRSAMADGLLDVRILRGDRKLARLHAVVAGRPRGHLRFSAFESWRAERLEIVSLEGPLRLARDGETFDGPDRFTIEPSPKTLEVFVP